MRNIFSAIFYIIIFSLLFSCTSENDSANGKDSAEIEVQDTSDIKGQNTDSEDIDSDSTINSDQEKLTLTKYICPIGDIEGNTDQAGDCPSCGMELIENPDYKSE
jgi:hypothetical protein